MLRIRPICKEGVERCLSVNSETALTLVKADPVQYNFDQVVGEDASQVRHNSCKTHCHKSSI